MSLYRLSYGTAGTPNEPRADAPSRAPRGTSGRFHAGPPAPGVPGARSPSRPGHRRLVLATLVLAHGAAVLGLLEAGRRHDAVIEARPMWLDVVAAPVAPAPPRPLPLPRLAVPPSPPLQLPLVAPEPSPSPSAMEAVPAAPPPAPPAPMVDAAAPAPVVPRTLPAAAVQFLVAPAPVYSRLSARMRESGKALVRVFVDEAGLPRNVQIVTSTGFARLDDAALVAVRNARFKPYVENGVAVAGWASIPIEFELPK
jgi:protein TonB